MTPDNRADATPELEPFIYLPDPPEERRWDGMVFKHLGKNGNGHFLDVHLNDRRPTLTGSSRYISPVVTGEATGLFDPDLFVAFGADAEGYSRRNGYVISEQGKPPDFVLEIASYYTGDLDVAVKRGAYENLGIPEYWRFDPTGEYNGAFLAADRLLNGSYRPIAIVQLTDQKWQGYSEVLRLNIRWENGRLAWYDPATGQHITTFEDERDARIQEQNRADQEYEARIREQRRANTAEARADAAEAALRAAEERIRQLEAEQAPGS